jgi:catechol 2,3-dioxygenase-like lactoylglutathione lyase family enzyme
MSAAIERLLSEYDKGAMTRRELVAAIAVLAQGGRASAERPPIPVRTLNHTTLFVSDVDRSLAFYQRLFGMPVQSRQENGVNLSAGGSFLGLYAASEGAEPQIHHFCLGVEGFDPDRTVNVLAGHGVEGRIRLRGEVKELYFQDPDGLNVQLQDVSYRG